MSRHKTVERVEQNESTPTWESVVSLAYKILMKDFKLINPDDLIGEAYLAFSKSIETYKPESGTKFSLYFANMLRWHMYNYYRYNHVGQIVHIPVDKYKDEKEAYIQLNLDAKVGEGEDAKSLHELIEGNMNISVNNLSTFDKLVPKNLTKTWEIYKRSIIAGETMYAYCTQEKIPINEMKIYLINVKKILEIMKKKLHKEMK